MDDDFPDVWDAIVIGAGPAGSTAAIQLARAGQRVVLIDKAHFPRDKVCGCCLSGKALSMLDQLQLSEAYAPGIPLTSFVMGIHHRLRNFDVAGGVAISRSSLDFRLTQIAQSHGVKFLPGQFAKLGTSEDESQTVELKSESVNRSIKGKVVLVCTGLAHGTLQQTVPIQEHVETNSRVGLTAIIPYDQNFPAGMISMAYSEHGYLGITVLEDGRLNLSAAVKKSAIKQEHTPTKLAENILQVAGFTCPLHLSEAKWMGTQELTRHLQSYASRRVFILGDAANYVEPFTGQGMEWAIEAAILVQPFATQTIQAWHSDMILQWNQLYSRRLRRAQQTCKWITYLSQRPRLVSVTLNVINFIPFAKWFVVRAIHGNKRNKTKSLI
jgi:flavin-dependent dehydrogenase